MKYDRDQRSYYSQTGFRMTGGNPTASSSAFPGPALVGLGLAVLVAVGIFAYLTLWG